MMTTEKTAQNYLYNLNDIPVAHRELFAAINENITTAFDKAERGNKSLTRSLGSYLVVIENELVEIKQYVQDAPEGFSGWWIASEANNKWYSDPRPTLKDLKESVGL